MDWDDFLETFGDPYLWWHTVKVVFSVVIALGTLLAAIWYFAPL